jgi:hypothetical protein
VNGHHRLGDDVAGHLSLNFDARDSYSAEALDVGFALNDHMPRAEATRKFSDEVDRSGLGAMQITTEFSLNQSGIANDTTTAQITFGCEMHVAPRSNRPVEITADFVIE